MGAEGLDQADSEQNGRVYKVPGAMGFNTNVYRVQQDRCVLELRTYGERLTGMGGANER